MFSEHAEMLRCQWLQFSVGSLISFIALFYSHSDWLQVTLLGVIGGYGVQTSILVQSLGTVSFIVNVMSDLLQILEVRPKEDRYRYTERAFYKLCIYVSETKKDQRYCAFEISLGYLCLSLLQCRLNSGSNLNQRDSQLSKIFIFVFKMLKHMFMCKSYDNE